MKTFCKLPRHGRRVLRLMHDGPVAASLLFDRLNRGRWPCFRWSRVQFFRLMNRLEDAGAVRSYHGCEGVRRGGLVWEKVFVRIWAG